MFTLESEFPDYDAPEDYIDLACWVKAPWHNNSCPNYYLDPRIPGLTALRMEGRGEARIWLEYKNPDLRESKGSRLVLSVENEDGFNVCHLMAETWDELRTNAIKWYVQNVGYDPTQEEPMTLGQILADVAEMVWFHNFSKGE